MYTLFLYMKMLYLGIYYSSVSYRYYIDMVIRIISAPRLCGMDVRAERESVQPHFQVSLIPM